VVEASTYDPISGRRHAPKVSRGFPDLVGNNESGQVLWIELKAKDRCCTLSEVQRTFLTSKIEQGCFAVVVDSVERIGRYYRTFQSKKTYHEKRLFLLDCLPKKRVKKDDPLF